MQSYSSHPFGTVFYHLMNVLSSKFCPTGLLRKISEIIENMIFSLICVWRKIWNFRQLRKIKKIWYYSRAFLPKCSFSCSEVCSSQVEISHTFMEMFLNLIYFTDFYFIEILTVYFDFFQRLFFHPHLRLKLATFRLQNYHEFSRFFLFG